MGTPTRSFRILRKNLQLTAIAVFSLAIAMALGVICCSSAIDAFGASAGVAPDRLATVYLKSPGEAIGAISDPDYQNYRHHNRVFSGVDGSRAALIAPAQVQVQRFLPKEHA
jgi:hypothetical protein